MSSTEAPEVDPSPPPPPAECEDDDGVTTHPNESSRTPDQPSRPLAPGRQTSPTDSHRQARDRRRKVRRTEGSDTAAGATQAPTLPDIEQITRRVSTSPPSNTNAPRRYKLPLIERNLRGKEYSGTFRLRKNPIDVPKYSSEEREKFVGQFTSEVNNQFSLNGRNLSNKQKVENGHMDRIFKMLMEASSTHIDGVPGGIVDVSRCSRYKVEDIIRHSPTVGSGDKLPFILAIKSCIAKKNSTLKNTVRKKQKQILGSYVE